MRRTVGGESVRKACLIGILLGFNCTWLVAPAVKIPLAAGIYSTTAAGRKHVRSLGLVSSDNRDRYLKKEKK